MFGRSLTGDSVLAELEAAAGGVVARVRDGALAGAPVGALADTLDVLRKVQAQLEWAALSVVREVDLSGAYRADGAYSAKSWLTSRARLGHREAADAVSTARALGSGSLDATSKALSEGGIDRAHAVVIARACGQAPSGAVAIIEPHALEAASVHEPGRVAQMMRRFCQALDPDAADAAAVRRYEQRGLTAAVTMDGMVAGRFLLDPVAGSNLLTALDAGGPLVAGDTRTPAQRRADALYIICAHYLNSADLPRRARARPHVIITRNEGDEEAAGSALSWVGSVPETTAERAGCDANLAVVDLDPTGEVSKLDKARRYFTWNQILAIIARDGDRCAWPYCDRPIYWSDGHHLVPVSEGGTTTVANGALPCEAHHLLLHEGRWTLSRDRYGRYQATNAHGHRLGPEPNPRAGRRGRDGSRPPPTEV